MRRYWIEKEAKVGAEVVLTGDTLHHIRDVCRMTKGSRFEVITEGGVADLVEITFESKGESRARVIESRKIAELPRPHIRLAMAVPRFPVFEAVLEKSVELGIHSVQPFFSEFSFIRTQTDVWEKKLHRFEKIVQSATQQSGRGELMPIEAPLSFENLLTRFNRTEGASGLFGYEGETVLSAKDGVEAVRLNKPKEVWIFIGSEGGFSDREVAAFKLGGLQPVTLGPQVLRVETACLALVSIIKYGLDLMR
jgi:16S rRNA (uracil1498-N3)-methyltransferase